MREGHSGTSFLPTVIFIHVLFPRNCSACPLISSGYAPSHCQNASDTSPCKLASAVVSELRGVFGIYEGFLQPSSIPAALTVIKMETATFRITYKITASEVIFVLQEKMYEVTFSQIKTV